MAYLRLTLSLMLLVIAQVSSAGGLPDGTTQAQQPAQSTSQQVQDAWSTLRNGPQNRGTSRVKVKHLADTQKNRSIFNFRNSDVSWQGLIWGTPIVDSEGNVYVGSTNKLFMSFDPAGRLRWKFAISDAADSLIDSTAALYPDGIQVIVPGGDGYLYSLNRNNGEVIWTFKGHHVSDADHRAGTVVNSFEGNVQIGPDGVIYAGSDNGHLYAINKNGVELWNFATEKFKMVWSSPGFSADGDWLAFGSLDGNLHILKPDGTKLLPSYAAGGEVKSSPAVDESGNIYFGTSNSKLISLHIEKGADGSYSQRENWTYSADLEIYSSPAIKNNKVVFGSIDGNFYALDKTNGPDKKTGKPLWTYTHNSRVLSSPLVTEDGVVLFGTQAGKLYALDLETGHRIWSYKTLQVPIKSNLDSSPSLDANGIIHVGSYRGNIYSIPYEYCLQQRKLDQPDKRDKRCEFDGTKDVPSLAQMPTQGTIATLKLVPNVVNEDSNEPVNETAVKIATGEVIQLELVAFENGEYINSAAINAGNVNVELDPPAEVEVRVSSDGKYLNIRPKTFFLPSVHYQLKAHGNYFTHATGSWGWAWDRFARPCHNYEGVVAFETQPIQPSAFDRLDAFSSITWALTSLYAGQPKVLDSYIPAALDGQGFMATAFGFNPQTGKSMMLVVPGYPQRDGTVKIMPEPSKVFTLDSHYEHQNIKGKGKFRLAAMGGDIPFDEFVFSMALDSGGNSVHGQMDATASCWKLRGSGSSFSFPPSLLNRVCDPWMNVIVLGSFEGQKVSNRPDAVLVSMTIPHGEAALTVTLSPRHSLFSQKEGSGEPESHLLTLVEYNPDTSEVLNQQTRQVDFSKSDMGQLTFPPFALTAESVRAWEESGQGMAVFLDGRLLQYHYNESK